LSSGETCVIRSAEAGDAEALVALAVAVAADAPYVVTQRHELAWTSEQERKWIADHSERPGWLALVATVGGEVIGLCDFKSMTQERLAHVGTLGLAVAAAWRGRGVGRALMTALLDWAKAHPTIEKVSLAVIEENAPAVALYRSFGFAEEGRRPREIRWGSGSYSADLLMFRMVKP